MAKRRTALGRNPKENRAHSRKTKKRKEIKRLRLEALKKKRNR